MNCLFQSDLPIPHLLYDKVQTAKAELTLMCGQTPRGEVMATNEVQWATPMGAFAETFIAQNCNWRVHEHGSPLLPSDILGLKKRWARCLWFMHLELEAQFPEDSLEVHDFPLAYSHAPSFP